MSRIFTLLSIFLLSGGFLFAQTTFSGILDSTVSMNAGAGDAPDFSYGIEEFANLRVQSRIGGKATFFGAVNLMAAAGDYAKNAAELADATNAAAPSGMNSTAFIYGQNYIAAIELERLYLRLQGEHLDFNGGLMRLPFGYGQVWGPSDFLNPKNPLRPDARPRGLLAASFSWYPTDTFKLLGFYCSPRDAIEVDGSGSLFGITLDKHWEKISFQVLYALETPTDEFKFGLHRMGLSLKADLKAGIVMDMLYTFNPPQTPLETGGDYYLSGLCFSLGVDYSFYNGKLIALAEYLFSGDSYNLTVFSAEADRPIVQDNNNYFYTSLTWRYSELTNIGIACVFGLDDNAITPAITYNRDLFQGASLTVTAQFPHGNGEMGKIHPDSNMGTYFLCTARVRLRF